MTMSNEDSGQIASKLKSLVFPRYLGGRDPWSLHGDDDLLNVFDSLQLVRMTVDLEALFRIRIRNDELVAENIGTVDRLASFIARKVKHAS
jgi:acyl carrier protein